MSQKSQDGCVVTVFCVANNSYVRPLAAMLASLTRNMQSSEPVNCFIVDGGVSRWNRGRLARCVSGTQMRLLWIRPPSARQLAGLPVHGHTTINTYYRLFIARLLPNEVERAIYLDVDTIILGDIAELWRTALDGAPLAAVQESNAMIADRLANWRALGLPPDAKYLNGGVWIADLKQWRQRSYGESVISHLVEHAVENRFWDQDGLNAIFAAKWKPLDGKWNFRVDCVNSYVVGRDGVNDLRQRGGIVHFASSRKPWHYGVTHPAKELFFEYLDQTAWAGWRPRRPLRRVLSDFVNIHWYGAHIRLLPLVGPIWASFRADVQSRRKIKGSRRREGV